MGLGYKAILFHCFRKACYRESDLFFSPTLSGVPNCLLFKGPTCHRASWQPRQSATVCVPASTETPEDPSGQAQLAIEHETDNILYQADMGLCDGLVGIMLSNV
ncbi:hypothetical protein AVEN_85979-1 [Araneus ventricosus]|uniref:Uncharacterized protein n=1 Tax=Araneus ventricosus TaxID=182803 RepID=A0A4Y2NYQ8_ARAVE|nr:hypothetical protein AVEN_85979-1 [Araneus ventricosus]